MFAGVPGTTSHSPAFRVLRMKPRRCAHHVYVTVALSSRAMISAILFSNPSPCAFENGRLLGSAQIRSSRASRLAALARIATRAALRERKHIERASLGRDVLQIAHGVDETTPGGRVARIEIVGHDSACPAANTR